MFCYVSAILFTFAWTVQNKFLVFCFSIFFLFFSLSRLSSSLSPLTFNYIASLLRTLNNSKKAFWHKITVSHNFKYFSFKEFLYVTKQKNSASLKNSMKSILYLSTSKKLEENNTFIQITNHIILYYSHFQLKTYFSNFPEYVL